MTDAPLPPPPAQPPYGAPGGYAPVPQTPGKAIAALVTGILGITMCPCFPLGIVAWVLGKQAEREIRASEGRLTGEGIAKAGWIMGMVSTILAVLLILFYVGIFGLMFATGELEGSNV